MHSRCARRARTASKSRPAARYGTPAVATDAAANAAIRGPSSPARWMSREGCSPSNTRALYGVRARESSTTRKARRDASGSGAPVTSSSRTVRAQSSASTVPIPVTIAQLSARRRCTSARAGGPVIQRLSPLAIAVRPSRDMASLMRKRPRPRRWRCKKPLSWTSTAPAKRPTATSMPASRRRAKPPPATRGFGSCTAATTRATPALRKASTQAGVRPLCAHGSSVTYAVAPRAASPAARRATISA